MRLLTRDDPVDATGHARVHAIGDGASLNRRDTESAPGHSVASTQTCPMHSITRPVSTGNFYSRTSTVSILVVVLMALGSQTGVCHAKALDDTALLTLPGGFSPGESPDQATPPDAPEPDVDLEDVEKQFNAMFKRELKWILRPEAAKRGTARTPDQPRQCYGKTPPEGKPLFASFHKAGVYASGQLANLFNATHDFYYNGQSKPYTTPVVVFTRNPFDMMLSGYEYHKRRKVAEATYRMPLPNISTVLEFGKIPRDGHGVVRAAVLAPRMFPFIEPVQSGESYGAYLERLPFGSGIVVEMVRLALFPFDDMLRAWRCDHGEPTLRVCMSNLLHDTRNTIKTIATFLDEHAPPGQEPFDVDNITAAYRAELNHATVKHSNSYNASKTGYERKTAHEIMRTYDRQLFHGSFSQLEAAEGCPCSYDADEVRIYTPSLAPTTYSDDSE
eukprot:m.75073 g.75073  ORF g.75073 m.75073 type:complete len:445 (+) comp8960_c0_seq1:18-1352(+)